MTSPDIQIAMYIDLAEFLRKQGLVVENDGMTIRSSDHVLTVYHDGDKKRLPFKWYVYLNWRTSTWDIWNDDPFTDDENACANVPIADPNYPTVISHIVTSA